MKPKSKPITKTEAIAKMAKVYQKVMGYSPAKAKREATLLIIACTK